MHRAFIEATAFGAKVILDRMAEYGVKAEEIVCCGGIAEKSSLLMQIYADILDRPMKISASAQACALGAAIFGAVVAGLYPNAEAAQKVCCRFQAKVYRPRPDAAATYRQLYALYRELHDSFGLKGKSFDHAEVMKKLLAISADAAARK
jgi:L-ribulokinase